MKKLVIVNPTSGQHRAELFPEQLSAALNELGGDVHYTNGAGDAERIALQAAMRGSCDAIIAAGGDGTVNEVVNGIMNAPSDFPKPTIGIIPLGTSNILATELGIPSTTLADTIKVIEYGVVRNNDIGTVNGRFFTLMASFGWDAEAVKRV